MKHRSTIVAVITADVISSSTYSPAGRRSLDRALRNAFRDAERRFRGSIRTSMAFRVTAGDEFQAVIGDVPRVMDILTYVRAHVAASGLQPTPRFRAAVGVGGTSLPKRTSSYEEDGPAFALSRSGLEALTKGRSPLRWTKLVMGDPARDAAADAVLSLADCLFQGWTIAQWEAVRWEILGARREDIAKRLRIAHQNVTKRLTAAGWSHLAPAMAFLKQLLEDAAHS